VLQDIVSLVLPDQGSEYDTSHIFFSMLGSLGTLSDCILRKLRGLVMVISLDCTRLELLGEGTSNSSANKRSEKLGAGSRRKKGKTQNMKKLMNPTPVERVDESSFKKLAEVSFPLLLSF
jgi:hypothetical protein